MSKKIYIEDPDLLIWIYPGYKRIWKIGQVIEKNTQVLYVISKKLSVSIDHLERRLDEAYGDFIIATSIPAISVDVILSTREEYLSYFAEVRKIRSSKTVMRKIVGLPDEEFSDFIKMSAAQNRWATEIFDTHSKVYELFQALLESKPTFFQKYFEITRFQSPQEVFSAMLTFFIRIESYAEQKETLSDFYKMLVKRGRTQQLPIKRELLNMLDVSSDLDFEIMALNFYNQLR